MIIDLKHPKWDRYMEDLISLLQPDMSKTEYFDELRKHRRFLPNLKSLANRFDSSPKTRSHVTLCWNDGDCWKTPDAGLIKPMTVKVTGNPPVSVVIPVVRASVAPYQFSEVDSSGDFECFGYVRDHPVVPDHRVVRLFSDRRSL